MYRYTEYLHICKLMAGPRNANVSEVNPPEVANHNL